MSNIMKYPEGTSRQVSEKLVTLRVKRVYDHGNDVRLIFEQADICPGDCASSFIGNRNDVELKTRATVKLTGDNTLETIFSAATFDEALKFLTGQWDLYNDYEDDEDEDDDED